MPKLQSSAHDADTVAFVCTLMHAACAAALQLASIAAFNEVLVQAHLQLKDCLQCWCMAGAGSTHDGSGLEDRSQNWMNEEAAKEVQLAKDDRGPNGLLTVASTWQSCGQRLGVAFCLGLLAAGAGPGSPSTGAGSREKHFVAGSPAARHAPEDEKTLALQAAEQAADIHKELIVPFAVGQPFGFGGSICQYCWLHLRCRSAVSDAAS